MRRQTGRDANATQVSRGPGEVHVFLACLADRARVHPMVRESAEPESAGEVAALTRSRDTWLDPAAMRTVRLSDGENLAYWDSGGDGPVIVFVHGFPENHRSWHSVIAALDAGQTARFRFIAYDLRGHGESTKRGEASWQRLFHDHLDFVAALGLPRYHLVGHDWGGAIGLHVSRYRPETIESLTVLNTNYWKTDFKGMWHVPLLNAPVLTPILFRLAPDVLFSAFIVRNLQNTGAVEPDTLESYRRAFHDLATANYWMRLYRNTAKSLLRQNAPFSLRKLIRTSALKLPATSPQAFQVPTCLIWGENDTFNPLWIGRDMERRLRSLGAKVELVAVSPSGHFVPEEQPDVVAREIIKHLSQPGATTTQCGR